MNDGAILFAQGNEACVRGALYAGLHFFAGYPITPSTEIAELLSTELPCLEGKFIQMEDEIASLCAVCAASIAGNKAMTATSGPGFSLMQEALGYAIMGEIPCVVTSVQRGGPSTGLPTKVAQGDVNQSRWGVHGDHAIIVLTASSVQDVFSVTVEGFNMAETYRTPVILLFDEVVGHMRERLEMPEPGELPVVERLRTSVKAGVNYYPYLPREDGRLPMSDFGGCHRDRPLEGVFSRRRTTGLRLLRQLRTQRSAPRAYTARQRHPGGVARTPDALALPVGTRAGTHGKGPDRLRGGDEYGPHGGTSPAERQKPGQGIPRQPGGRAAHHAHRHQQSHARNRRQGVLIWPSVC